MLAAPAAARAQSAANAREVYNEALKREAEIRREMDAHRATDPVAPLLVRLRTLVGSYADMARIFPNNEQADQALWQGAKLSEDAFWRFGDEIDRAAALSLLEALVTRFPDSSLVVQATPRTRRLSDAPVLRPVPRLGEEPAIASASPPAADSLPRIPGPGAPVQSAPSASAARPPATTAAAPTTAAQTVEPPPLPATEPLEPRASSSSRIAAAPPAASPAATASTPPRSTSETVPAPGSPVAPGASASSARPTPDRASPAAPPGRIAPPPVRSATPVPSTPAGQARLTSIQGESMGDAIRFTLELDREVRVRHEQFGGPPRIVIDLQGAIPAETLTQALLPRDTDAISRIRVGRHDDVWTRVVIELRTPSRYGIGVMHEPYRVVIDVHPRPEALSTATSAGTPRSSR